MKVALMILVLMLLGSNAFWLYQSMDSGVTSSYASKQIHELNETRKQLSAVLTEVGKNSKKSEIITVASKYTELKAFEKDGCTWVGWIGFKFNEDGNLASVSPAWSYGEKDPCYPAL